MQDAVASRSPTRVRAEQLARVDARFLLPAPLESVRAVGDAGLAAALDAGDTLAPDVVWGDTRAVLRERLADAPTLVLEGRPRGDASLRRQGYELTRFLALPRPQQPLLVAPLDTPRAACFAIDRWTSPQGTIRRLRNRSARALVARGLLPPVRQTLTIAHRGPAQPFLIAAAHELGLPERPPFFLRAAQGDALSRGVFFVFEHDGSVPSWVVKFARVPDYRDSFDRDEAGLAVAAASGAVDERRAPRLVGRFAVQGFHASVETAAVGRPLTDVLTGRRSRYEKLALVEQVLDWVVRLSLRTQSPPDALAPARERLRDLVEEAGRPFPTETIDLIADVPAVVQHNDLGCWNVLVDSAAFTAVDWESAARLGPPLWDLWYFLADAAAALGRVPRAARVAHAVTLFRGEGELSELLFTWTRRLVDALGIPDRAVGPLAALCWLHHSDSPRRRAEALDRHLVEPSRTELGARPLLHAWLHDPALGASWSAWRT